MEPGLIGGLLGAFVGLLGGVLGTWASIRNTHGPRERAFVLRCCVQGWAALAAFLVALFLLPAPWKGLLWVPYGPLLFLAIRKGNREQERIRGEEAVQRRAGSV
jgi:hypothetical protein